MSSTRVLDLESGNFRAIHWAEAPGFGAFWRLARVKAKGDCRLRELNRLEGDIGWGSGHLESIECPRRGSGRCSDGQAEMREDLDDHGGVFDGGNDLQGTAALGTVFDVDVEHPFEVRFVVWRIVRTRITTPATPKGGLNYQLDTGENPVRETHT